MSAEAWSALASSVGVIVAIAAIIAESRRSRFSQGIELISRLDERFESPEFRETRRAAATHLLTGDSESGSGAAAVSDVLNFFETIAYLYRKKVLDADTVWHYFASWLLPYYVSCEKHISKKQQEDPNCYRELKPLHEAVFRIEEHERSYQGVSRFSEKSYLDEFLNREATLPLKAGVQLVDPPA